MFPCVSRNLTFVETSFTLHYFTLPHQRLLKSLLVCKTTERSRNILLSLKHSGKQFLDFKKASTKDISVAVMIRNKEANSMSLVVYLSSLFVPCGNTPRRFCRIMTSQQRSLWKCIIIKALDKHLNNAKWEFLKSDEIAEPFTITLMRRGKQIKTKEYKELTKNALNLSAN